MALKSAVNTAMARYEKEKEEKSQMEMDYGIILAELDSIPAELSSSRWGMLGTEKDIMKEEGGNVVKNENEADMKEEGEIVPKEEGKGGSVN